MATGQKNTFSLAKHANKIAPIKEADMLRRYLQFSIPDHVSNYRYFWLLWQLSIDLDDVSLYEMSKIL